MWGLGRDGAGGRHGTGRDRTGRDGTCVARGGEAGHAYLASSRPQGSTRAQPARTTRHAQHEHITRKSISRMGTLNLRP